MQVVDAELCHDDLGKIRFRTQRGCPEGGVLSNLLFCGILNAAINAIKKSLDNGRTSILNRVNVCAFADDVTLFSMSHFKIAEALRILMAYTEPFGMRINFNKTCIIP